MRKQGLRGARRGRCRQRARPAPHRARAGLPHRARAHRARAGLPHRARAGLGGRPAARVPTAGASVGPSRNSELHFGRRRRLFRALRCLLAFHLSRCLLLLVLNYEGRCLVNIEGSLSSRAILMLRCALWPPCFPSACRGRMFAANMRPRIIDLYSFSFTGKLGKLRRIKSVESGVQGQGSCRGIAISLAPLAEIHFTRAFEKVRALKTSAPLTIVKTTGAADCVSRRRRRPPRPRVAPAPRVCACIFGGGACSFLLNTGLHAKSCISPPQKMTPYNRRTPRAPPGAWPRLFSNTKQSETNHSQ